MSIDNKVFKLQVWDTAGQDRFRQVVSIHFRSAHCVMLTYDMTRRESFDSLDDVRSFFSCLFFFFPLLIF